MSSTIKRKSETPSKRDSKLEHRLLTVARQGDRSAYLQLFMSQLPGLDHFIRHEIHYSETIGAVEQGLIDPCAVLDQVYIAALSTLDKMPKLSFRAWLRYLALHIMRQQVRLEHKEEPVGPSLERALEQAAALDTEMWEYYQPDDVLSVEDILVDRTATDPESVLEMRETEREIEQSINGLPSEMGELIKLRMIEGLGVTEIAALKGMSPELVRQRVQQACEALRKSADRPG